MIKFCKPPVDQTDFSAGKKKKERKEKKRKEKKGGGNETNSISSLPFPFLSPPSSELVGMINHDIEGFDITVHNSIRMGVVKSLKREGEREREREKKKREKERERTKERSKKKTGKEKTLRSS